MASVNPYAIAASQSRPWRAVLEVDLLSDILNETSAVVIGNRPDKTGHFDGRSNDELATDSTL